MKDFKIKFKNGRKELELEAGSIETPEEWLFIKNILSSVDIKTGDIEIEVARQEEKEAKLMKLEEGYNVLSVDKIGVHRPVSEFETSSIMAGAYRKAQEKKNLEQAATKEPIPFKQTPESVRLYNNVPHYQCYSVCPKCGSKFKKYITPDTKAIVCKTENCKQEMEVRDATDIGFPHEDIYRNVFIAGKFVRVSSSFLVHASDSHSAV